MSLLCAFAWNLPSMVVFRACQGLFGGAMIPAVFAVIYTLFPTRLQQAMAIVVGLVVTMAPTTGPVLGGYLTETVSWKLLFAVWPRRLDECNLTHEAGYWEFFWPQALRGFALMFCFLPINSLALGTLPPEEVKNASGLYNLMRNLGGAIGLAVSNTVMIQLNKQHYAVLREAVTPGSPETQSLLESLQERLARSAVPDGELAALKELYGVVMREAEVLTLNTMFHTLSLTFFLALLLMPLIKKASTMSAEAEGRH